MADNSWAQLAINQFFEARKSPSQAECDQTARSISNASVVHPVDIPGSLSYTVVGTGRSSEGSDLVISFREERSTLDDAIIELARSIHGCQLVPEVTYHGQMTAADSPLHIYTMSYLRGIPPLAALGSKAELSPRDVARHICHIKSLARYFARCWLMPQPVDSKLLEEHRAAISRRLTKLKRTSPSILPDQDIINKLEQILPILFSHGYPQVLTHNDLSSTNILVDQETLEITGIVDWSVAKVLPFGMELFCLYMMTGYMALDGWHDYTCRDKLHHAFWQELSSACTGHANSRVCLKDAREVAQLAAKLGAVLHFAFQRSADGSPSEEITTSEGLLMFLPVLLAD